MIGVIESPMKRVASDLSFKDQVQENRSSRRSAPDEQHNAKHAPELSIHYHPDHAPVEEPVPFAHARIVQPSVLSGLSSVEGLSVSMRRKPSFIRTVIRIAALFLLVTILAVVFGLGCRSSGCFRREDKEEEITTSRSVPVPYSKYVEVLPDDLASGDGFGGSVAIQEDTLVVGSFLKSSGSGGAYVFRKSTHGGWAQEQKLLPDPSVKDSRFGRSVAAHGRTIVVGADFDDHVGDFSGSAYVFALTDGRWLKEQKLTADDASADSLFGFSVAIYGDTIFVGAPNANNQTGSAYVYLRNSSGVWSQQLKLVAFDGSPGDLFGSSVSVNEEGNIFVVGAAKGHSGSAHVFAKSRQGLWVELDKLRSTDSSFGDSFGRTVAVSGETIVVGAIGQDGTEVEDVGTVYSFKIRGSGWDEQQKIQPRNATTNARFGSGLAISDGILAVASRYGDGDASTVHVYFRVDDVWEERLFLVGQWTSNNLRRATLAIDGKTIAIGSTYGNTFAGSKTGAVYLYEISDAF